MKGEEQKEKQDFKRGECWRGALEEERHSFFPPLRVSAFPFPQFRFPSPQFRFFSFPPLYVLIFCSLSLSLSFLSFPLSDFEKSHWMDSRLLWQMMEDFFTCQKLCQFISVSRR